MKFNKVAIALCLGLVGLSQAYAAGFSYKIPVAGVTVQSNSGGSGTGGTGGSGSGSGSGTGGGAYNVVWYNGAQFPNAACLTLAEVQHAGIPYTVHQAGFASVADCQTWMGQHSLFPYNPEVANLIVGPAELTWSNWIPVNYGVNVSGILEAGKVEWSDTACPAFSASGSAYVYNGCLRYKCGVYADPMTLPGCTIQDGGSAAPPPA